MVGDCQNNMKIYNSLKNWISPILSGENQWEANNIHIDEISSFEKIARKEWIDESLNCINVIISKFEISKPFLIFLHFDLSSSKSKETHDIISYKFLVENISEFTPPSFNCTTEEYYFKFYKKELSPCSLDDVLYNKIKLVNRGMMNGYFRTYFDETENEYSRELYIFFHTTNG